jgi:hypothetical protein
VGAYVASLTDLRFGAARLDGVGCWPTPDFVELGVEHVGTAHTEAELGALMREARLAVPGQGELDLGIARSLSGKSNSSTPGTTTPGQLAAPPQTRQP